MTDFDIAVNIRDLDGNLVLALEDEANGYWIRGGGLPSEERHPVVDSVRTPWVDGAYEVGPLTFDRYEVSVLVKVFGSTWVQVEQRLQALMDATRARAWIFEYVVEGVSTTRRAGPVEVSVPPSTTADRLNKRRYVALSFPVQPTPTVTGA